MLIEPPVQEVVNDRDVMVHGERLRLTRVAPRSGTALDILAFHGIGATAGRRGIRYLLDALAGQGLSSVGFDFSGHGDSSGDQETKTLADRLCEARAIAAVLEPGSPKVLLGTSMGAYVALKLAKELRPQALILFCPALYSETLRDVPFGAGFRDRFSAPDWYGSSMVLNDVATFSGDVLIIGGREDAVTPPESLELLYRAAGKARSRRIFWVFATGHLLHDRFRGDLHLRRQLLTEITSLPSIESLICKSDGEYVR